MARFCSACGTRNEDAAGFCGECGRALRAAVPPAPAAQHRTAPAVEQSVAAAPRPSGTRAWALPAVIGAVVLIAAGAGFAWWSSPPVATPQSFAAALAAAPDVSVAPSADLLCVANLPYDRPQINVNERDVNTRTWMDALAAAGLYTPGVTVEGFFQQSIQYLPTSELAAWRRGARLCLAKAWSLHEIKGTSFTPEKRGTHTIYRASAVWKADGTAPWLPEIPTGRWPRGLRVEAGSVFTESAHAFEVRDRRWVALTPADERRMQLDIVQAGRRRGDANAAAAEPAGLFTAVTNWFGPSGAAHPLVGEWALDENTPMGMFAAALPFQNGHVIFGNDFTESGGERVKTRFDVSGDVVKVRHDNDVAVLQFRVKDKNTIVIDAGLIEIPLKRVR